jgi:ABC-2 type transport system ATP-binding protein
LTYAIETEGLTKIYKQRWSKRETRAVDGISLRVDQGATFGLLGPNGAGKTTFVKMLLSCSHPTEGRALVFGKDSWITETRRSIGYLPENHRFPTYLTGRSMLDFYGALAGVDSSTRRRKIPELLDLVGLDRWATTRLGKYSKGMLQRAGLAQALLNEPRLLILDEPSDGVDPVGRKQIRDILHALEQKGVTIFLNSHLLQEVELFCRDVAIIYKGRVALEGRVKELTSGSGYRLEIGEAPDNLRAELKARATAVAPSASPSSEGRLQYLFATRDDANRAIDFLRSQQCEVESLVKASSTLEEVFIRTVEQK